MATLASGREPARRRGTGRMNVSNQRGPPPNLRRNGAGGYQAQQSHPTNDGVYGNEKMVHGLMNMLGYTVVVTVKNGSQYEGILSTVSSKMDIHLSLGNLVQQGVNGQMTGPLNRDDVIKSMIFKASDIVSFCASNVDYDMSTRDNFTDGAISRNGQSVERDMKELEPWIAETNIDDSLSLEGGTNGWDAHDMFKRNAEQFDVKSTYDENLSQYTTPLVRKNDREYRQKEEEAERIAREIESTETYKTHSALENGDRDEEDKFSAVVRAEDNEPSNTGRYIPPNRRNQMAGTSHPNHPPMHRGPASHMPPLPQREKRERDRGWESAGSRQAVPAPVSGSSQVSVQAVAPQPHVSSNLGLQRKDPTDIRMNGDNRDRKNVGEGARPFPSKPVGNMSQAQSVGQRSHPQAAGLQQAPPVATIQPQIQHTPSPVTAQPVPASQNPATATTPISAPATSASSPVTAVGEKPEARAVSPQSQMQPQAGQTERMSRDKEKVEDLKRFGKIFKLPEDVDERKVERGQEEKRSEVEEKKEDDKTEVKINESVLKSNLNPNAKEFKPSFSAVKTVPAPSPTPPRQSPVVHPPPSVVPIQPGPNVYSANPYTLNAIKMVPITTNQQNVPQRHPKRAVVSVHPDPAQLAAHHATGQPLLAAQAASMPGQQFVYQVPQAVIPQGATPPFQMMTRVVPPTSMHMSHQGGGVDPIQASSQTPHAAQQIFVAQPGHAPIPAHMAPHPGSGALSHPQPAHTHMQHHQQHQQHHPVPVPPGPQSQSGQMTPHPSASPVQHMAPNGHNPGAAQPHHAHTQGAPPTSGTPQPSLTYGQQIGVQGHPPVQPGHAHPAHSHAGHSNPNPQALHPVSMSFMPHSLQANSFSQAGGSGGGGGPAPAHVQHSTHTPMGQPHHVVVMPQPPPHSVNPAISSHHHHHHGGHQYQQHHVTVTGPNQVHGGAGQTPHLLPGNMHTAIPVSASGIAGMHPSQLHGPFVPPATQYKHAVSHQGGHFQGQ